MDNLICGDHQSDHLTLLEDIELFVLSAKYSVMVSLLRFHSSDRYNRHLSQISEYCPDCSSACLKWIDT